MFLLRLWADLTWILMNNINDSIIILSLSLYILIHKTFRLSSLCSPELIIIITWCHGPQQPRPKHHHQHHDRLITCLPAQSLSLTRSTVRSPAAPTHQSPVSLWYEMFSHAASIEYKFSVKSALCWQREVNGDF